MLELVLIFFLFLLVVVAFVPVEHGAGFRTTKLMSRLPMPKSIPIFSVGLKISKLQPWELIDFLKTLNEGHPRLCKFWIACLPFVLIKQPKDLEVIMGSVHHIEKGYEYNPLLPWLNEGLLVSSGKKWHVRRKILTPTFHFKILQNNLSSINYHARLLLKNMLKHESKAVKIEDFITLCTLDVICDTAMGIQLNSQENGGKEYVESIKRVSSLVVARALRFWLFRQCIFNLTSIGREFKKQLKILHEFTENIIHERKRQYLTRNETLEDEDNAFGKRRRAFLDSMIEMDIKYPNSFTIKDIREEVDTFMFEGHDTTSAAIMFGMYLLGHHQDIQEKVFQEQYSIFGDSEREATKNDLQDMTYLDKVIKEVLRLYPSVPYFSRMLTTDAQLSEGVVIPKGTNVLLCPYIVHRNEKYFPNPEEFDPERFTPEECAKRHPYAYIPFSAGPRNCIGQKFANMELKIIFSTLIRFSHLETLTKPEELQIVPLLILRTKDPILVKVTLRPFAKQLFDLTNECPRQ